MKRFLFAIAVACARSCFAHDFWIEPSTYRPAPGQPIAIRLLQGERFRGEPVARNDKRIERFVVRNDAGDHTVGGASGDEPAGRIESVGPGVSVIGFRTYPLRHGAMTAAEFEAYLREEGLERIIQLRASRGDAKRPATEMYSRSAKALLVQPGPGRARFDEPLGLRFEIVPESDPHDRSRKTLRVRLLMEGRPVAGVLVTAIHRDDPRAMSSRRSDRDGRATLPIARDGRWLVKAVHMVDAPKGSGVDWESIWATLTFEK